LLSSAESELPLAGSLEGERLDHFELLEVVGGGGMGIVFRALDTALNRIVALKILSSDRTGDDETVRRFRKEAQSAARLDHDNIARVYYVGQCRGLNYIAFEFIDGVNVRDLVAHIGPLPLDQALSYSVQIAQALIHASSRNVVHRDIKPSNILITVQGRAKLVDMGLSRMLEPSESNDLTASGVTLGTFDYISPEQARDPRCADVRSDIYSLGCTIYYMLTGEPPFPDGNAMQKLLQHQGESPPDPAELNPFVPEELSRIVLKALAKDPRRRYQDPRALIADLALLTTHLGIELPGVNVALLLPGQSLLVRLMRQHLPWLIPLAAMIAAVFVLDQMWTRHDTGPPNVYRQPMWKTTSGKSVPLNKTEKTEDPNRPNIGEDPMPPPPKASDSDETTAAPTVVEKLVNPKRKLVNSLTAGKSASPKGPVGGLSVGDASGNLDGGEEEPIASRLDPGGPTMSSTQDITPPPMTNNALVVDPEQNGNVANTYSTLKEALENATSGATIDLRYSGFRESKPIKLPTGVGNVTVRPAEGYHPVVRFVPDSTDSAMYPRHMIALNNTQGLTFVNMAFELINPPTVTSGSFWAMFSLYRSSVTLKQCTLTIVNADDEGKTLNQGVSFFEVQGVQHGDAVEETPVKIKLKNCVARGEAVFLNAADSLYPIVLEWDNGLLATTEQLFKSGGGRTLLKGDHLFEIRLDHLTANVQGGLCLLENPKQRSLQLKTVIHCTNSILLGPDLSLVRQNGVDKLMTLKTKLAWTGNKNWYEGIRMFWKISDGQAEEQMMFKAWQKHWGENRETPIGLTPIGWKSFSNSPLHKHVPSDYRLKDESPARGKATDNDDVGAQLDRLPSLEKQAPAPKPIE